MDEPTSALSSTEVTVLFRIIRELKARNRISRLSTLFIVYIVVEAIMKRIISIRF
jgi:ABC-type sugar transport system ATPase subunit